MNKNTTKKVVKKNQIQLEDGEGMLLDVYIGKITAMLATLSPGGKLALFHLIIKNNNDLNEKRNEMLK